jgi:hypothetical protein
VTGTSPYSSVPSPKIWLKQSLGIVRLPVDSTEMLAAESFESLPLMASHARQISLLSVMPLPHARGQGQGDTIAQRQFIYTVFDIAA